MSILRPLLDNSFVLHHDYFSGFVKLELEDSPEALFDLKMDSFGAGNVGFCLDVFKELSRSNVGENIFFSPLSLFYALSMILLGTRDKSAEQMEKVLHYDQFSKFLKSEMKNTLECHHIGGMHSEFGVLLAKINQPNSSNTLSIANRLYGTKAMTFRQKYLRCSEKLYQSKLQVVDFETSTEATRKIINAWVEYKTNGKVTNLFGKGAIDPSSVLVLVSAIYFKGQWQNKFQERNTVRAPFHPIVGKSVMVKMMYQTGKFKLADIKKPQMQVLELPYASSNLSMVILLPHGTANVKQIERQMNMRTLHEWTNSSNMVEREVEVNIPRFKLEMKYELNSVLKALGMRDVFNVATADFSGMSPDKGLYLNKVIHKSYVDVTEEGTEAAAATGESVAVKRLLIPVEFKADRPFLFIIRDSFSHILFAGRLASP